jgi:hypothetical protein
MSVTFSDPRNDPKLLTYLLTDNNGNYTYSNPDLSLQSIQKAFNVLYTDINGFNNATATVDLDKYALNILGDLQGIVAFITPCSDNKNPQSDKCILPMCKYVQEIQNIYIFFLTRLTSITQTEKKKSYDFLSFFGQNYLATLITNNSNNLQLATDNKYVLCFGPTIYPVSDDPKMKAVYDELMARQNAKLQTVQTSNNLYNLMYGAIALLAIVIILYIVKIVFFSGSTKTKKIGGMLRPGPPNYVRLV